MPHARSLGGGLCELRFTCRGTAGRVPYYIVIPRRVITLTPFGTQRRAERREVARARQAMRASQQAGGTDGEPPPGPAAGQVPAGGPGRIRPRLRRGRPG